MRRNGIRALLSMLLAAGSASLIRCQDLDETWTVTINGRSVRANPDGSFFIGDIPVVDQFGREGPGSPPDSLSDDFFRVTATRSDDGVLRQAFSAPFQITQGEIFLIGEFTFSGPPLPRALGITPERSTLLVGETVQLAVHGILFDGSQADMTPRSQGTIYRTSNPRVASVSPDGLVSGTGRGSSFISAVNAGVAAVTRVDVVGGTPRLHLSGLVQLPDGTAAVGATIRVSGTGAETTARLDGTFDLVTEVPLGVTFSVVLLLSSGGQQFSRTVELEAAEGLEQIDLGSLILVPVGTPPELFLQRVFESGLRPFALAAADIDGDGDPDLAAVNQDHTLGVLRNQGDGTFAPRDIYSAGLSPQSVALADLDGDGDADAAVASGGSSKVVIFRNQGDGTFASDVPINLVSPRAMVAGDIDLDGDTDLLVAASGIALLLNQGDAKFAAPGQIDAGDRPLAVELADIELDGDLDIIGGIQGDPAKVSVIRNQGGGTFAPRVLYPVSSNSFSQRIAITVSDLDGDEVPDVAATNFNGAFAAVFLNRADGTLFPAVEYPVGTAPSSISAGDLDADGDPDLCVANSQNASLSVLLNRADGTFLPHVPHETGGSPAAIVLEDFDGDGDRDAAVANSANVQVLRNHGDGTLESQYLQYFPGAGQLSTSTALGDVDGDGDADLALGGSAVQVLRNVGAGAFGAPVQHATDLISPSSVLWADLDGDGDADLAVADFSPSSSSVSVLRNQGGGTLAVRVPYVVGTQPIHLAAGDLDGDGDTDLVTANFVSKSASVLRNNGDATFAAHVPYTVVGQPQVLCLGDLDGDGDVDIAVVAHQNPEAVSILRNRGDATFADPVTVEAGCNPISVALGDLDGDGDADLAVGLYTFCSAVSVLRNEGNGAFAARVEHSSGTNPRAVAMGDLDKDGEVDIVVANETVAAISFLRNLGDGAFAAPIAFGVGAELLSFALGDLDGDGDTDIVAGHSNAEGVTVLLNQTVR